MAAGPHLSARGFVFAYSGAALAWLILRGVTLPLAKVAAVALLLRALLLFAEPTLSGDVYRYLWDGRVSLSGINPYRYAPDDAHLASLRRTWHPEINHPEIATIYPPLAQALFIVPGAFSENAVAAMLLWRLLIVAFDLMAIFMLGRHALAYATFPLLLFEGAWSGHVDAIAAALVVVAVVRRSGLAAGFAAGLKLIPGAALPAMTASHAGLDQRAKATRVRFLLSAGAAFAAPFLLFAGGPLMPGLRAYASRWIFNSPLYDVVFAIVERIPTAAIWTRHPLRFAGISDLVYQQIYPDFVTRAILGLLAIGGIALAGRSVTRAIAALLICSPAIHPWYWLAVAGPAMIERSSWIYVALAAPFSYLLYDGVSPLLVATLCYALPLSGRALLSANASSAAGWRRVATPARTGRGTSR